MGNSAISNPWTVIREEVKFDCPFFFVREDLVSFDHASPRPYRSIRVKKSGICVAPIDSDGNVTLVGQYRYVLGRSTWELPGGGVSIGAPPLTAAGQELAEETGMRAGHWREVIQGIVAGGTSDETFAGYVAWDIEYGLPNPDPEERLTLRRVPFSEAVAMALANEINHLSGVALILGIQARLQRRELPDDLAQLLK
jgi:8-oxo-dGTP pyrophosphatase MutT (NUDIX family)